MKLGNVSTVEAWRAGNTPPPGTYVARIDECEEGTSRNGYNQFTISWTVVGGQFDGAEITEWLVVSEPANLQSIGMKKLIGLVDAVGIDRTVDDFELTDAMLVGKHAKIVVTEEPSQNDPTKMFRNVVGHKHTDEVPAAAANGANGSNEPPLPF